MKKLKEVTERYIKKHIDEKEAKVYQGEPIDFLMYDAIKVLNEKGYKTHYCCSGHFTPYIVKWGRGKFNAWNAPYIAFNYRVNKFMRTSPVGWYLDHEELENKNINFREPMISLRVEFSTYLNAVQNKNFYKWITLLYNNFYEWVNELPDVSEEIDYAKKTTKTMCCKNLS